MPDAVCLFSAQIGAKMERNRNKSAGIRNRKMKGEKRRNYDASSFKEAYLKVVNDKWSVYKASKEYGVPWSTLKRHIANHGGENSLPNVPQSSNSTRRPKRNPEARYLTAQNTNINDNEEERIVVPNETIVPVAINESVLSSSDPPDSLTPGSSNDTFKGKHHRVKREKAPQSNKSTMCDYCGIHYSQDVALRNGAVWVECMSCCKWYHQECTGTESPQFLCDSCDSAEFSGADDSDWSPE